MPGLWRCGSRCVWRLRDMRQDAAVRLRRGEVGSKDTAREEGRHLCTDLAVGANVVRWRQGGWRKHARPWRNGCASRDQ